MLNQNKTIFTSLLLLISGALTAQIKDSTTINNNNIDFSQSVELYKSYQHIINNVKKLENIPAFSDTNFLNKTFEYSLPVVVNDNPSEQNSEVDSYFIKNIGTNNQNRYFKNYAILGYETKHSPFAELSLNHKIDNISIGLFGYYQQDSEKDREIPYFGYKNGGFKAYGNYNDENFIFKSAFNFNNQVQYLAESINLSKWKPSRVDYSNLELNLSFTDLRTPSWLKDTELTFGNTSQRQYVNNNYIQFNTSFNNYLDLDKIKWHADLDFKFSENEFKKSIADNNNLTYLNVEPALSGYFKNIYIKGGLSFIRTWDANRITDKSINYLMPELHLEHKIKNKVFTLGVNQSVDMYDYATIVANNPFLSQNNQKTAVITNKNIYGGVNGVWKDLNYRVNINHKLNNEHLFFFKNPLVKNSFQAHYLKGQLFQTFTDLSYSISRRMDIQLSMIIQKFISNQDDAKELEGYKETHLPLLTTETKFNYRINNKVNAYSTLLIKSKQYSSENFVGTPLIKGLIYTEQEIKSIFDLSVGADLTINRNLKAFLEARNLLNKNYEVWQNYAHKGFYLRGGFRYKF